MTIEEFKKIIEKENKIAVAATRNDDVYIIDQNEKKVLAWISGEKADFFTILVFCSSVILYPIIPASPPVV